MGPCYSLLGINRGRDGANTPLSASTSTKKSSKSTKSGKSNEPTQEELEREERAAAAQLYAEKEKLLEKAKKAFEDGGHRGPGNILEQMDKEAGRQEADLAMLEEAAIRQQKLQKRREAKRKAEAEQKWMVFSNLDAFDEKDLTKLAGFMEIVVKNVPKLGDSQWTDKEIPGETDSGLNIIEEYLALKAESTNRLKRCDSNDNLVHEPEKGSSFNEGSPDNSSRSSMQFGKGGLRASGRDSMLSQQSSNYSERGITIEKKTSRTRSEMIDAIKANRRGSGTSLNVISIVNTSSFNISPASMGTVNPQRRHSLGENDVITVPRRISRVMGYNKLEFNPMALDQGERSGPLLELGKDEKKGKDERSQKQQAHEEAHRRGTCILDDNVLGKSGVQISAASSMHEDSVKMLDHDHNDRHDNNTTINNHDNHSLTPNAQSQTSDNTTADGSVHGPASLAPKHGSSHPMPQIHTVTKMEDNLHDQHHTSATIIHLPKPPSHPHPSTDHTTSGVSTAHENSSTHPPAAPAAFVPEVKDEDLILPDELLENFDLPHGPITPTVARVVLSVLKQGGKLSMKSVHKILRIGYKLLTGLPNTTICTLSPQDRLTVVGDIHGQLPDLLHILDDSGFPSTTNRYLFNGDFVDRGPRGVEVMCLLLTIFAAFPPKTVMLNRGNHEDYAICCVYGFQTECVEKYDEITFGMFVEVFSYLPMFTIVNNVVMVVHGGLFHTEDVLLSELNAIDRVAFSLKDLPDGGEKREPFPRYQSYALYPREQFLKQLARDALWSDPRVEDGYDVNHRGAGVLFGPDRTRAFLKTNKLKMIVRSHECVRTGFARPYVDEDEDLLCTIFSASNYGNGGNAGAYLVFSYDPTLLLPPGGDTQEAEMQTVPDTDLHYTVLYYDIEFPDEDDEDFNEDMDYNSDLGEAMHLVDGQHHHPLLGANNPLLDISDKSEKVDGTSQSLYGLVYTRKHLLLEAFEKIDAEGRGLVTVEQWADVMKDVTRLSLQWQAMLPVLVLDECFVDATPTDTNTTNTIASSDSNKSTTIPSLDTMYPDRAAHVPLTDSPLHSKQSIPVTTSSSTSSSSSSAPTDGNTLRSSNTSQESQPESYKSSKSTKHSWREGGKRQLRYQGFLDSFEADFEAGPASTVERRASHEIDSLYAHHRHLQAVFRFFDRDGSGIITNDEFKHSCELLNDSLPPSEKLVDLEGVMKIMDVQGTGMIDMNDFFEMFRLCDLQANHAISAALFDEHDRNHRESYATAMANHAAASTASSSSTTNGLSGKDETGRDSMLSHSRHGSRKEEMDVGGKVGVDELNSSRRGERPGGGGANKNWGLVRNTVKAISGSTAQKEHGGGDTLGTSRHGSKKEEMDVGGKGGVDQLGTSRHGDRPGGGGGGGANKNWGLLRNTVRAISGSTAQKEHGGGDTLGTSRHGGDKDALSTSRHGEENEATVAMFALLASKSTAGPVKSLANPLKSDVNKDAPPFTKKSSSKSLLLGSGFLPAEDDEATVALSRQPSSLARPPSFIAQPDFAEGDERAYSPAGKTHKTLVDATATTTTTASVDGVMTGGKSREEGEGESEQMKKERLTKKINDLLLKK